jgi:hypothetical protein
MFCPRCGTHNDDNAWKCIQCGADLHTAYPTTYGAIEKTTSSKAIWSLVLAIIGPCCCTFILGILAIVLGVSARKEIRENPDRLTGDGIALAGIIIGIIDIVIGIGVSIFWLIKIGIEEGLF